MLRTYGGDVQLTNKFLFKYLKSGEGAKYLLGHVDNDLGCKWERFSKKYLSLLYTFADYKIVAFSSNFLSMFVKTTLYFLDMVKDVS